MCILPADISKLPDGKNIKLSTGDSWSTDIVTDLVLESNILICLSYPPETTIFSETGETHPALI